jgi:hypothetical protein
MQIKFNGSEDNVLEILSQLPSNSKAIRRFGNSIIIPTDKGAKQVYIGDTVIINNTAVEVLEGK